MIVQEEFDFAEFLSENFAPVVIVIFLVLLGSVYALKALLNRRSEDRRALLRHWKALKPLSEKLTDRLTLKIYPFGHKWFEVDGDIYIIDSKTTTIEYSVSEIKERHIEKLDRKIIEIQDHIAKQQKQNPSLSDSDFPKENAMLDDLKDQKQKYENLKPKEEQETITIKEKTETYAALNKKKNSIVGFRFSKLKPSQSVLSETGFLELSRIDPRRSNMVLYLILGVLFVFDLILMYAIFEEIESDFIVAPNMWGWYAVLALVILFTFYLMRVLFGFYAICYAETVTYEETRLQTPKGKNFTKTIPIYWLETYFYPNIQVEDVLGIDTDSLATKVNKKLREYVTDLSSKVATLQGELDFAYSLLDDKSKSIDTMEDRLLVERARGYYEGRKDNTAIPEEKEFTRTPSIDWTLISYRAIPFLFGLVILGIMIIGVKWIADSIHLDPMQTTIIFIAGVVILLIGLIVAFRSLMESTRRSPVG